MNKITIKTTYDKIKRTYQATAFRGKTQICRTVGYSSKRIAKSVARVMASAWGVE